MWKNKRCNWKNTQHLVKKLFSLTIWFRCYYSREDWLGMKWDKHNFITSTRINQLYCRRTSNWIIPWIYRPCRTLTAPSKILALYKVSIWGPGPAPDPDRKLSSSGSASTSTSGVMWLLPLPIVSLLFAFNDVSTSIETAEASRTTLIKINALRSFILSVFSVERSPAE